MYPNFEGCMHDLIWGFFILARILISFELGAHVHFIDICVSSKCADELQACQNDSASTAGHCRKILLCAARHSDAADCTAGIQLFELTSQALSLKGCVERKGCVVESRQSSFFQAGETVQESLEDAHRKQMKDLLETRQTLETTNKHLAEELQRESEKLEKVTSFQEQTKKTAEKQRKQLLDTLKKISSKETGHLQELELAAIGTTDTKSSLIDENLAMREAEIVENQLADVGRNLRDDREESSLLQEAVPFRKAPKSMQKYKRAIQKTQDLLLKK
jgi:hypothetical protein